MKLILGLLLFVRALYGADPSDVIVSISDESHPESEYEIPCAICDSERDLVYWCNAPNHVACSACLLTYSEGKIMDGHEKIMCPFADPKASRSSEWQTHWLIENKFLDHLSPQTKEIYSAIKQRVNAIQLGYAPCSTKGCPGMIQDGREGAICEICHEAHVAEVYPSGTRLCTFCRGPLQKDQGCNTIKCGFCLNLNNWEECLKAKTRCCGCLLL